VRVVIDASATIAWLFEDENDEASQQTARFVQENGAVAPAIWRLEVANVLRSAERRGRCSAAFVDQSLARLDRLSVAIDGDTDRQAWNKTLELSRAENLTAYDAAYLELAVRQRLPLATRDQELIEAARRTGVSVLGY
jgi:predicted nucleic acid-binding protein